MKPVIGVMPLWDEEKDSIWMLPGYMDGISKAGGIPIIFPFLEDEEELSRLIDLCDGLVFTGGQDVSPRIYHEEPLEGLIDDCEKRDSMEEIILQRAIAEDKPILGICRGIQFINAALGGTLYQDIPSQHPSATDHHQQAPYELPIHEVRIVEGTPLHECLKVDKLPVNSLHHQAVKTVAPGLTEMAISPDGIIEALYRPESHFLWAVQWHPEFSYLTDESAMKIFKAFIEAIIYKD